MACSLVSKQNLKNKVILSKFEYYSQISEALLRYRVLTQSLLRFNVRSIETIRQDV
ncbi:hypothetical protein HanRHA438_Chr15g0719341 [Helianthus annuus]|nr:hypothetical protein HanPSC8_Chr15g0678691 [Helianthus annuus]KAJ0845941.1 hypothetical protein HanRHA438_Chr15g0719341 [Helianthus annuus]